LNINKNESGKARSIEHVPLLFKRDDMKICSHQAAEAFHKFFLTLIDCRTRKYRFYYFIS